MYLYCIDAVTIEVQLKILLHLFVYTSIAQRKR